MKSNKSRNSLPYRVFVLIPIVAALLAVLFFSWKIMRESLRLQALEKQVAIAEEENHALREELGLEIGSTSSEADPGSNGQ